jgi:hypothetical protein
MQQLIENLRALNRREGYFVVGSVTSVWDRGALGSVLRPRPGLDGEPGERC